MTIPIVMASDNNYAVPLYVSVASAVRSKGPETAYRFHMLVSDDFSRNIMDSVDRILELAGCPAADWIFMGRAYQDASMHIGHTTTATYYRLQIPDILKCDKCIYLDVDICVCGDLSELFNTDLSNYYIAGVKAAGYYTSEEERALKAEILHIEAFDRYINAGVAVMNLAKIRRDDLIRKFDELIPCNFRSQDQDILNSACYPNIKILPPKFNAMTKYPLESKGYDNSPLVRACFSREEWEEASEAPVIVHYADARKPWMYRDSCFADRWWNSFSYADENAADRAKWTEDLLNFYRLMPDRQAMSEKKEISRTHYKYKTEIERLKAALNEERQKVVQLEASAEAGKQQISELAKALEAEQNRAALAEKNLEAEQNRSAAAENELEEIKNSSRYKIGVVVTYIPGKIFKGKRNRR